MQKILLVWLVLLVILTAVPVALAQEDGDSPFVVTPVQDTEAPWMSIPIRISDYVDTGVYEIVIAGLFALLTMMVGLYAYDKKTTTKAAFESIPKEHAGLIKGGLMLAYMVAQSTATNVDNDAVLTFAKTLGIDLEVPSTTGGSTAVVASD